MDKPNITVLLSTFNGELFLQQQLDSIYAQKNVKVNLYVRDDGSKDDTLEILERESKSGRLTCYTGPNLKPAWSFWHLLTSAPEGDYFAFSDQDDFWMDDKLFEAYTRLKGHESEPALYFSQTQLADSQLNPLPCVVLNPLLTYGEALIHQFVGGCTMLMNAKMRDVLLSYTPKYMQMHDFWIYDVALAVGAYVTFDSTPHMLYRQHNNNAVGQLNQKRFVWESRLKRLRKRENIRLRTAHELWLGYHSVMSDENRRLTYDVINYQRSLKSKWRVLFDKRLKCSSFSVNLSTKLSFLLNLF